MSIIYLVRHAQASFGTENYDRLSELGRQQSRWLGEYFAGRGLRFSRAFAGTLTRQRDTAQEILAAMGAQAPEAIERHRGLDEYPGEALYRAYAGRDQLEHQRTDFKDYWRTFRAAMQAWADDSLAGVPETWEMFGARIRQALDAASAGHAAQRRGAGGELGRCDRTRDRGHHREPGAGRDRIQPSVPQHRVLRAARRAARPGAC